MNIRDKIIIAISAILGGIVVTGIMSIVMAWLVMLTWNATMPYLFELPKVGWCQAFCLYFLANCLVRASVSTIERKQNAKL